MGKKNVSYEDFVEKFKPKKTTDDCYTPPLVYDALLQWARKHLDIEGREVVRPFWPDGDYESFDYPEGCVVIDNPPFSIFKNICDFYNSRGIGFLLFAPGTTSIYEGVTYIGVHAAVIYENGASVATSFVTNMMGDLQAVSAPELHRMMKEAVRKTEKGKKKEMRKLQFPPNVLRASTLHTFSRAGIDFCVRKEECRVVGKVGEVRDFGKSLLLNSRIAAERIAAERIVLNERCREILSELDAKDADVPGL